MDMATAIHTRLRSSRSRAVAGAAAWCSAPRFQLRTPSTAPSTTIAMPSRPGSSPGTVTGLMFCCSSRSIVMDPTSTARPNTTQPMASLKSARGGACSSSALAATERSGTRAESVIVRRSGLRDADGVGRDLGLAAGLQVPGIGLHGGEHGLLRSVARQRVEQRAAGGGVLLERLALDHLLGPDLLQRLHHFVGRALGQEDAEVVGRCGEAGDGGRQRRNGAEAFQL